MTKIQDLLVGGLAVSTRRSYDYWWTAFVRFCNRFNLSHSIPVDEFVLCGFAAFSAETACHATIKVAIAAIKSRHTDLACRCDTQQMVMLQRVLRGIQLKGNPNPSRPRLPVTTELLAKFRSILDLRQCEDQLFFAVACVGTYGLFRSGEIFGGSGSGSGLLCGDVKQLGHLEFQLTLRKSKTDINKQGVVISLFANGSLSCPVRALDAYWQYLGKHLPKTAPLFCLSQGVPLKKDLFISMLRLVIAKLGLSPSDYSGHSFRRGGATSLAAAGVPAAMIKQMGRWKSLAYQVYIDNTKEEWAKASQAMSQAEASQVKVVFGVNRRLFG
jgi:hypothetical protein